MTALAVLIGRVLRFLTKLRGGGSALPGRVALMLQPNFLKHSLGNLERGIVFVTGSNGKSTTTHMLVRILREHGLRVLTNPAGGNLPQGLASALLAEVSVSGKLNHDIAVLEVDEGYGRLIARKVAPNDVLITNIQLDQLNRFHSPEEVYKLLDELVGFADRTFVVNGSDPNTARLGEAHSKRLDVSQVVASKKAIATASHGLVSAQRSNDESSKLPIAAQLETVDGRSADIAARGETRNFTLPSRGLHYAIDAALAVGMAQKLLAENFSMVLADAAVSSMETVFGRGEIIKHGEQEIEVIMMKNLPSLQVNLDALETAPTRLWISVDEGTPDPSWIYDIDLGNIERVDVVSGTKAHQWATRLIYEGIPIDRIEPNEREALKYFLSLSGNVKTAIVNYEQMMWLRKQMGLMNLEGENG